MYELDQVWKPVPPQGLRVTTHTAQPAIVCVEQDNTSGAQRVLFSASDLGVTVVSVVAVAICRLVASRFVCLLNEDEQTPIPDDHAAYAKFELQTVPFFHNNGVFDVERFVSCRQRLWLGRRTGAAIELRGRVIRRSASDWFYVGGHQTAHAVFLRQNGEQEVIYTGQRGNCEVVMRHIAATPWSRTITTADLNRWATYVCSANDAVAVNGAPQRSITIPAGSNDELQGVDS